MPEQSKAQNGKGSEKVNFTELAHKCRHAKDDDLKDLFKKHEGAIKRANLRERKINRVGMPLAHRVDDRLEEIPIVCGGKKLLTYAGAIGGCIYLGAKVKQLIL